MSDRYPDTPDGRYFVVRGRLWRKSNPVLDEPTRNALVKDLTGGLGGLTGGGAGGLADLGGLLGGASSGSVLGGGPGDLVKQFQQNGQRETAKSWVETGPNTEIDNTQLSRALGPDVLDDLSARTGLSPEDT